MSRESRETIPESPRDELLDFEEGLLDLTHKKKKWYQFKTAGKYFSGLVTWLPNPVSQFVSDSWRMITETVYQFITDSWKNLSQFISDSWKNLSQFFSSDSSNPRLRDFIVHGSIALVVTTAIITTTILTMGLGPLIMASGTLAATGIISAIAVTGLTVSAIWGGLGAAWQGFLHYLDENWSNVPKAKTPTLIEENIADEQVSETYSIVPAVLPVAVAAAPTPQPTVPLDIPKVRVQPHCASNPELAELRQDNAVFRRATV